MPPKTTKPANKTTGRPETSPQAARRSPSPARSPSKSKQNSPAKEEVKPKKARASKKTKTEKKPKAEKKPKTDRVRKVKEVKPINENMGITDNAIKRLARQAGVAKISSKVYIEVREIIKAELEELVDNSLVVLDQKGQKTVKERTVLAILPVHMHTKDPKNDVFTSKKKHEREPGEEKTRRSGGFRKIKSEIRHFQRQYNTFLIRSAPFKNLVRHMAANSTMPTTVNKSQIRFSSKAINYLQNYIESHIVDLMRSGLKLSIHAGRVILFQSDVALAHKISRMLSSCGGCTDYCGGGDIPAGRSFSPYISKVLKTIRPNDRIRGEARSQLDGMLSTTASKISQLGHFLISPYVISGNGKSTISAKEISNAVKLLFPAEFAIGAVQRGDAALVKFTGGKSDAVKRQRKEISAGLIFSVSRAKRYLRQGNDRVSSAAPVFLAAVLEYMAVEFLGVAADVTRDAKKTVISARHLVLSVHANEKFKRVLKRLNYRFIKGGVAPTPDEKIDLLNNRKTKKSKRAALENGEPSEKKKSSKKSTKKSVSSPKKSKKSSTASSSPKKAKKTVKKTEKKPKKAATKKATATKKSKKTA